ncbi:MAG: hypothetical protein ACXV2C_05495, partial [Candidatus Bathyarchaeia archaeon]
SKHVHLIGAFASIYLTNKKFKLLRTFEQSKIRDYPKKKKKGICGRYLHFCLGSNKPTSSASVCFI